MTTVELAAAADLGEPPTTPEKTPAQYDRPRQQNAAATLALLLTLDLPCAYWSVAPSLVSASLDGQITARFGDAETRVQAVRQWAEALGLTPFWDSYAPDPGGDYKVEGDYRGVKLQVWTHLDEEPTGGEL